jgi:hypothetical protein
VRQSLVIGLLGTSVMLTSACAAAKPSACGAAPIADPAGSGELIRLADRLTSGRLRPVNREVSAIDGGPGIYITAAAGTGLVWIDGTHFGDGMIEADVCGRDVDSESFLGIAFHRRDDETFEAVYLRPFNFHASGRERRQHAVQYVALPEYDYSRLRQDFPGQFEKPVDPEISPTAWNRLRVIVQDQRLRVFVGRTDAPAFDVRELRPATPGQVGLFTDNNSDGVFANVRVVYGR